MLNLLYKTVICIFSVTQLTSYHQVTPGQQVNYKLFYKSNISERKVLKNMKVRIYVPADQKYYS